MPAIGDDLSGASDESESCFRDYELKENNDPNCMKVARGQMVNRTSHLGFVNGQGD